MSGTFGARRIARYRPGTERSTPGPASDAASNATIDLDSDPLADPAAVARSIALNLLTAAPRTRSQLAGAMSRRAVPDDVAAEVLERFAEVGLIDDAAFAQAWVTSRQSGRGLAPRALANELRKRGVEEPVIAEAVSAVPRDDVESTARALVRRRTRAMVGLSTEVKVRRLSGMLARKGYPGDIAIRAVRDVLAEQSVDVAGELGHELAEHVAADDL